MRTAFFCSGYLGFNCLISLDNKPILVFTDKNSTQIINYARFKNIPLFIGNPRQLKAIHFFNRFKIEFLLSVNYLFLLPSDIYLIPKIASINIHGSYLPKYRGRSPHIWAIINGEKITGITAHLITENCDEGDIVCQKKIPIEPFDTGYCIIKKYKKEYPKLVKRLFFLLENNSFKLKKQDPKLASFFPKRLEEDGLINWNWDSKRIYNWVRAQAKPYPMAFTYYNSKKIKINSVSISKNRLKILPGTIISLNPFEVKSKNGSIIIEDWESDNLNLKSHTMFTNEKS